MRRDYSPEGNTNRDMFNRLARPKPAFESRSARRRRFEPVLLVSVAPLMAAFAVLLFSTVPTAFHSNWSGHPSRSVGSPQMERGKPGSRGETAPAFSARRVLPCAAASGRLADLAACRLSPPIRQRFGQGAFAPPEPGDRSGYCSSPAWPLITSQSRSSSGSRHLSHGIRIGSSVRGCSI